MFCRMFVACACLCAASWVYAGPQVTVVTGDNPSPLLSYAASELSTQLTKLFEAEVRVSATPVADAAHVVLLGRPETNAALAQAIGDRWPKLGEQGHVVRTLAGSKVPTVIVGGGSDLATLWAVYELGHHFGIRSLPHGDMLPTAGATFKLDGLDLVLDTELSVRGWRMFGSALSSTFAWSAADLESLIGQLVKNKINLIVFELGTEQPFVEYTVQGQRVQGSRLFELGQTFDVTPDTPGRRAFGENKLFTAAEFAGRSTPAEQLSAAQSLVHRLMRRCAQLGIGGALRVAPTAFPRELRGKLPDAIEQMRKTLGAPTVEPAAAAGPVLTWLPGTPHVGDASPVREATHAQWQALHQSYPEASAWFGDHLDYEGLHTLLPNDLKQHATPLFVDGSFVREADLAKGLPRSVVFSLDVEVLHEEPPHETLAMLQKNAAPIVGELHAALSGLGPLPLADQAAVLHDIDLAKRHGWRGMVLQPTALIGEATVPLYALGRAAFSKLSVDDVVLQLYTPIAGRRDVAERMLLALQRLEEANHALSEHYSAVKPLTTDLVYQHPAKQADVLKNALGLFTKSYNEVLRAHGNAPGEARPLFWYHAKRGEFSLHYLGALVALAAAGEARDAKQAETHIEQLEKAVEALYNAGNALSEASRDTSDQGLIAELDHQRYRPLVRALDKVSNE